jgi:DNA-binding transcriptional LysR family regulator
MQGMDYVYEVYHEKSFSAAARKLFVSQPALSAAVKKVEKQLGLPLFDRSTSPIQLTTAGKAYIEAARQIMTIQKNLHNYIGDLASLQSGNLSLGGTNFFASCLLPCMIKSFSSAWPKIRLRITESDSADLYARLLTEEIDLIVDSGLYDAALYESIPLLEDHILLAVPSDNSQNKKHAAARLTQKDIINGHAEDEHIPAVSLSDFAGEDFLLLGRGNDMYRRALDLCHTRGFTPNVRLYLNQLMTAYHTACQGLGLTFLTDSLVKYSMPSDALVYYKILDPAATRKIFIACRKNSYRTRAMQEFICIAQGIYQQPKKT